MKTKPRRVTVKIQRDVYDELKKIRDAEGVPISVTIRLAVRHYAVNKPRRRGRPPKVRHDED